MWMWSGYTLGSSAAPGIYLAERETETRDPGLREPMGFLILILICCAREEGKYPGEWKEGVLTTGGKPRERREVWGWKGGGCGVSGGLAGW
jgi:hypothetical protein